MAFLHDLTRARSRIRRVSVSGSAGG